MKAFSSILVSSALFLSLGSSTSYASGNEEGNLIGMMADMQYFLHKAGLSIEAENAKLSHFYLHELEETIEQLESFGNYKDQRIGELVKSMLTPSFEALEDSLETEDYEQTWGKYESLMDSCNRCHQATKHEFINIEFNGSNPYMQSFDDDE